MTLTNWAEQPKIPSKSNEREGWSMSIREYRPGKWQVRLYHKGQRHEFCKTIDGHWSLISKEMALETERDLWGLIRSTKGNLNLNKFKKKQSTRFPNAVETWITLSTCDIDSIELRKGVVKNHLIPFFGQMNLEDIEDGHLQQFHVLLKQKGLAEKTIYNVFGELKALFNRFKRSIPFLPEFPKISYQESVKKLLTFDQQTQIFEFIEPKHLPIFTFMRFTGCRPNEAGGLLRENVFRDADPPYVILSTTLGIHGQLKPNTKTRKVKPLLIIPEIAEALKPKEVTRFAFSHRGRAYRKRTLERIWDKANVQAMAQYGTSRVPLYQGLRHSFATQRLNAGYPLDLIGQVMGHTNIRTTQKYAKYQVSKLEGVMRGK